MRMPSAETRLAHSGSAPVRRSADRVGIDQLQPHDQSVAQTVALLLISCVGAAAVISYSILFNQLNGAPPVEHLFVWASAGSFVLPMGYVVDPLGPVMLALVTTIALLVLVYSHGYMAHDKGYVRFFTYLALFSSSMLGLIISPNLLEIYVFWELVGMCSYLLVGFWYDRDGAAHAAQKAFVVNRVGDFGLLLGILGLFWATGSFDFQGIADGLQNGLPPERWPHGQRCCSACWCSWVRWPSRPSSLSMCGCPMPWKAQRRFQR